MTLAEFLLARIAENEMLARAARKKWPAVGSQRWDWGTHHIATHDPARVLAECEAKRAIVRECGQLMSDGCNRTHRVEGLEVLRALATVYADHPDYQDFWKP